MCIDEKSFFVHSRGIFFATYIVMKKYVFLFLMLFTVSSVFAQNGKGAINIAAYPEGVSITFMGAEYQNAVEQSNVAAGKHHVSLRKEGFEPVDTLLEVKEGITRYYSIVLTPKMEEYVVDAKPTKKSDRETKTYTTASKSATGKKITGYVMLQAMLTYGCSQGIMAGASYKGNGIYGKFAYTFIGKKKYPAYTGSEGRPDGSYIYDYTQAMLGYMREFGKHVTAYAGGGYGQRKTYHQYTHDVLLHEGQYETIQAAAFETGVILRAGIFAISGGVNTVAFKTFCATAGIGVTF